MAEERPPWKEKVFEQVDGPKEVMKPIPHSDSASVTNLPRHRKTQVTQNNYQQGTVFDVDLPKGDSLSPL